MENNRKYLATTIKDFLNENATKHLTVYHGTLPKFVDNIKQNGLEDKTSTPYNQGWYMVSTDFDSALYHASVDDNKDFVYVFEFKIPLIDNIRWLGYPYLWLGYERNNKSMWFALKEKLPPSFITKIHKVSYNDWNKQKNKGF